jgi:hypothetical protein
MDKVEFAAVCALFLQPMAVARKRAVGSFYKAVCGIIGERRHSMCSIMDTGRFYYAKNYMGFADGVNALYERIIA